MLIFRPLFYPASSTWSYLLGDAASGEAVQSVREDAVRQAMGRAADVALAVGLSECEATGLLVTAMRDRADAAPSREGDVRDE